MKRKRKCRFILFVGPVASGKTTQRLLVHDYLSQAKNRTFTLTFPPFSFLSYSILTSFKWLLLLSRPDLRVYSNRNMHSMAFLEEFRRDLVGRIIGQLILIDSIQELIFLFAVKMLNFLDVYVTVEDFFPTIDLEHNQYAKLYENDANASHTIAKRLAEKLKSLIFRSFPTDSACVYLQTNMISRYNRSIERGYRIVNTRSLHDQYRDSDLEDYSKAVCKKCIVVNTDSHSISDVFRDVVCGLRSYSAIK